MILIYEILNVAHVVLEPLRVETENMHVTRNTSMMEQIYMGTKKFKNYNINSC